MTYKYAWAEAYYNAMDDGCLEREAVYRADLAGAAYVDRMADLADWQRECKRENGDE